MSKPISDIFGSRIQLNKRVAFRAVFVIWLILWINFIARDLFVKKNFRHYKELLKRDEARRRSYVYGDDFYNLLSLAADNIPENATFNLIGVEEFSIDYRRAIYFLYPRLESHEAEYSIVYNDQNYGSSLYALCAKLDEHSVILRKK